MKKRFLTSTALFCIAFASATSNGDAQVLTINDGSTLTINGGVLDVNCLDILVKNNGRLYLETGTLKNMNILTLEPESDYHNTSGTIIKCGESSFYLIPNPDGPPVIITLPKNG